MKDTNRYRFELLFTSLIFAVTLAQSAPDEVRLGRFSRGTGTNGSYHSLVLPLSLQSGLECAPLGGIAASLLPWNTNSAARRHYDAAGSSRFDFKNPVAAFGKRVGGTPMYLGQTYKFGVYAGQVHPFHSLALQIQSYTNTGSGWVFESTNTFTYPLPVVTNASEWGQYLIDGYQRTFLVDGLTTVVKFDQTLAEWGVGFQGTMTLSHIGNSNALGRAYQVELVGSTDQGFMVLDAQDNITYSRMYSFEFSERAPWQPVFLTQPHFNLEPLPPDYQGKSTLELLTNIPPVTTTISLPNPANTYTNLDSSPELRRHPILDQFVTDMRSDPLALARFVQNEIELTDAVSYNDNGDLSEISINPPGVSRGALGTYLEGQGGPAEQCSLLVYLLRQAGVPSVFVYPHHNEMKMLDTRLSQLMRLQFKGAADFTGQTYTTNSLIPVNYPWVAAHLNGEWVHIFPWLKDTEIIEGLNLYDYLGGYRNGFQWALDYLYGATNILDLADADDTAGTIFPRFVERELNQNHPGISLDDIGTRLRNRKHQYSRWDEFPVPFDVPTNAVAIESLSSDAITNVFPELTNIFDIFHLQVTSAADTNKFVTSGFVRMLDIHNRRFVIRHEKTGPDTHKLILTLAPFRPGATGLTNFVAGDSLLNAQYDAVDLDSGDDDLIVTLLQFRQRSLPVNYGLSPPSPHQTYPGMFARTLIGDERNMRKGDLAAVCINVGRVTKRMLNVHLQELRNLEDDLSSNPSLTNSIAGELYQGAPAFLTGMGYYKDVSRGEDLLERLHKVQIISSYGHGLSKLSAKRVSGQLPNQGDIILRAPNVDMAFQHSAIAFNGTLHAEVGEEQFNALMSFRALWAAHGSAAEHQILNTFYQESESVSTVKLLQLAQQQASPGIIALNFHNYVTLGNTSYNGALLKDHDPPLWAEVTNWFARTDAAIAQVFMTPGPITTGSYVGSGAFLWSPSGELAAIITPNQNGGFAPFVPETSYGLANTPNISWVEDAQGNISIQLEAPTAAAPTLAPDNFAKFNIDTVVSRAQSQEHALAPIHIDWMRSATDLLGLGFGTTSLAWGDTVFNVEGTQGLLGHLGDGLNQRDSSIADPVHAVTGEFYVQATDLTLPGPMPLAIQRNYSSHNFADNSLGFGWKINYMPYLSLDSTGATAYATEPDGAVIAYHQTTTNANVWLPEFSGNPLLNNNSTAGIGSVANRARNRLEKSGTTYTLWSPDGSVRVFEERTFSAINRTRPYLDTWTDSQGNYLSFEYGTDPEAADYAEARRIQSSNGGYLGFEFDVNGHILLAYTGDGRRVSYEYDEFGDLVRVDHPDDSWEEYEYEQKLHTLPDSSTARYSTHLLLRERKPDGRVLVNEYDGERRVTNQLATVGMDLNPIRNATFVYSNNFALANAATQTVSGTTTILDVFNNPTTYRYTNGLITAITNALGHPMLQEWYDHDDTAPGQYPRSLKYRIDKRGLRTDYTYDHLGNVTNTTVTGDITGNGNTSETAVMSTVYGSNNLPVEEINPNGAQTNRIVTVYDTVFTNLPAQVTVWADNTAVSTNLYYYTNVTATVTNGAAVVTNKARGLLSRSIEAGAVTNDYFYDGRGYRTMHVQYPGSGQPPVTDLFQYNDRGELFERVDPSGTTTRLAHDPMGRPQATEIYATGQSVPLSWRYSYYNDNGELTWTDGPRYAPEDYAWFDYDGAGRLVAEVVWRAQAKSDGSGAEAPAGDALYSIVNHEHDAFGNRTRTIDPRGNYVTNVFDAIGQRVAAVTYDGNGGVPLATNGFAYEPGGKVFRETNALGGVIESDYTTAGRRKRHLTPDGAEEEWRYYRDGRLQRRILSNDAYWETTYDDAAQTTTNIFYSSTGTPLATNALFFDRRGNRTGRIDNVGNAFTNLYDGMNREIFAAGPEYDYQAVEGAPPAPGGLTSTPVRRTTTTTYVDTDRKTVVRNAFNEENIAWTDALGRPSKTEVRAADDTLIQETSYAYSADHYATTITRGSGAGALISTDFTDSRDRNVLEVTYPATGVREFSRRFYDTAGNLVEATRWSDTNGSLTLWSIQEHEYEARNLRSRTIAKAGEETRFHYDPAGNLTNRILPGGLEWRAEYEKSGQLKREWNRSPGGVIGRDFSYEYWTNGAWVGLLRKWTPDRPLHVTYFYDDWLRVQNEFYQGIQSEYTMTATWAYDVRSLVTNVTENFAAAGFPDTEIRRTYDPYGALRHELILVDSNVVSSATQSHDSAGRRRAVGFGMFGYNHDYQADGRLISVSSPNGSGIYAYDLAGQLETRTVGNCVATVTSRDGTGRPLTRSTTVSGTNQLVETLAYTGDGRLASHQLVRPDFTDQRSYEYAPLSRRLAREHFHLDGANTRTNEFTFDLGQTNSIGVLTATGPDDSTDVWAGVRDNFFRINRETNRFVRRTATGHANGPAYFSVSLDGRPMPVTVSQQTNWTAELELLPGAHQLTVEAVHPSLQFTNSDTHSFTLSGSSGDEVTSVYSDDGQIESRTWKNAGGQVKRTQTFTWDGKGRLLRVGERDPQNDGYDWSAVYDAFDRRLQTTYTEVDNNVAQPATSRTIEQFYDPEAEFLELGVFHDGRFSWKVYGPDLDGRYGGMNGTGGYDAFVPGPEAYCPTIADVRGNIQAIYDQTHAYFIWFPSRPTAYGAAPGYRPLPLDHGGNVVSSSAWRGRWSDVTGLTWLGARYYDQQAGRFLSADPFGHAATPDLYSFANGDPVNFFDPDGRFAANALLGALEGEFGTEDRGVAGVVGQIGVGFTPPGVLADGRDFFVTFSEFMEGDAYFTDVLFAGAMIIPGASELKNGGRLYSSLDEAAELRRAADEAAELRRIDDAPDKPLFKIDDGVRRSKSAEITGQTTVPAKIKQPGQPDQITEIPLDQLRSPKTELPADSRFFDRNLKPAREGSKPPPIEVVPISGEIPGHVPIPQVKLVPPNG